MNMSASALEASVQALLETSEMTPRRTTAPKSGTLSKTTEESGLRERATMRAALEDVCVRPAISAEEKQSAYRIRYEVYVEELGEFRFSANREQRLLTDATDDTARHYYVTVGDQVVGALRYHLEQDEVLSTEEDAIYNLPKFRNVVGDQIAILSRFNVHKDYRYSHVPAELLQNTLPFDDGVELIFCTCMPHLLNLYFKLGFRSCGPLYNDAVASVITPLVLIRGDIEHFRQIGSPLADRIQPSARSVAVARKVRALLAPPSARQVTEERWEEVETKYSTALFGSGSLRVRSLFSCRDTSVWTTIKTALTIWIRALSSGKSRFCWTFHVQRMCT